MVRRGGGTMSLSTKAMPASDGASSLEGRMFARMKSSSAFESESSSLGFSRAPADLDCTASARFVPRGISCQVKFAVVHLALGNFAIGFCAVHFADTPRNAVVCRVSQARRSLATGATRAGPWILCGKFAANSKCEISHTKVTAPDIPLRTATVPSAPFRTLVPPPLPGRTLLEGKPPGLPATTLCMKNGR